MSVQPPDLFPPGDIRREMWEVNRTLSTEEIDRIMELAEKHRSVSREWMSVREHMEILEEAMQSLGDDLKDAQQDHEDQVDTIARQRNAFTAIKNIIRECEEDMNNNPNELPIHPDGSVIVDPEDQREIDLHWEDSPHEWGRVYPWGPDWTITRWDSR